MRRLGLLLAVTALAACDEAAQHGSAPPERPIPAEPLPRPAPSRPPAPLPGVPVKDAVAIVGEWRVAGTGDQALSQSYGMSASIGRDTIRVASQCVFMTWTYRLADGMVKTTPVPSSVPPCLRPQSADEQSVESAIRAAARARRLDNGALLLSGPGGSVSLFAR